jgi:hypothetical protein
MGYVNVIGGIGFMIMFGKAQHDGTLAQLACDMFYNKGEALRTHARLT